VYLYSALFVAPHTQGAQAWIILQFYLHITPCLPLPRKRSPGSTTTDLWWRPFNCSLLLICRPQKDERLSLDEMNFYIPGAIALNFTLPFDRVVTCVPLYRSGAGIVITMPVCLSVCLSVCVSVCLQDDSLMRW